MTRLFTDMRTFPLFLCALLLTVACFAESPYEREMKQLKSQRDAAVAASTKAQDERYRAALEQTYRRATQAKDAAAESIKTELLTLGPLRAAPPAGVVPTAKPSLPSTMFGKWSVENLWHTIVTYDFKQDGTCEHTPGTAKVSDKVGTWSKSGNKIEVIWPDGNTEAFDLPIKAGKLEGLNVQGNKLWATKKR